MLAPAPAAMFPTGNMAMMGMPSTMGPAAMPGRKAHEALVQAPQVAYLQTRTWTGT